MRYDDAILKISKAYYNKGLEKARRRDLSGAAGLLKLSLRFDKYHTQARNLLGLIFYESGETADAIAQWVLSINFAPGRNDARRYLDEIQNKAGVLESESSLIRRFNQALAAANNSGEDFARIELRNIVKNKPNYIRAQLLLATLCLKDGDTKEAVTALSEVLSTDRTNPRAVILMDEAQRLEHGSSGTDAVRDPQGAARPHEASKDSDTLSHRELQNDDIIIPRSRSVHDGTRIMLFVLIGLVLGLLSFYILILPTVKRSYNETLNDSIVRNSDNLSELNDAYSALSSDYEDLSARYADVESRLTAYEQENLDFTTAYGMLNSIVSDCAAGDYLSAADTYTALNRDNITTEPLIGLLNDCDRLMLNDGIDAIETLGTDAWNGGNKTKAEEYYRLCLSIKEDDPEIMFLLARLLQSQDRISEANEIFDRIVGEHPESPYAERSVEARGY